MGGLRASSDATFLFLNRLDISDRIAFSNNFHTKCILLSLSQKKLWVLTSVQHPDALYLIYRCYLCGCRYPGAAADRPPRVPLSKRPERRNARKLSPIYATGTMERVGGKNKKTAIARKSAAKTESRQDEEKRKGKKKCGWAWTWETPYPIPARGILRRQLLQQATLVPLLPLSHSSGGGNRGSHTSPSQARATKLTAELSILFMYSYLYVLGVFTPGGSAGSESESFFEPLGSTDLLLRRSGRFDSQNLEIFRQTSPSLNKKNETCMKLSRHTSKNLQESTIFSFTKPMDSGL